MFKIGDKVLLSTQNLPLATTCRKTTPRWAGPFLVTNTYPATDNYRLKLPKEYNRIHPTFHVRLLKRYHENDNKKFPSRKLSKPGPLPEFDDECYEVRQLLGRRITKTGKIEYHVRWKGYGPEDDNWEPVDNIDPELIEDYENQALQESATVIKTLRENLTKTKGIAQARKRNNNKTTPKTKTTRQTKKTKTTRQTRQTELPTLKTRTTR